MTPDFAVEHAVVKTVVAVAAGVTMFTAGASAIVVEVANVVYASQLSDNMILLLAGTALTVGTGIFAFTFKKLMDVLQMVGDLRRDVAVLAKTIEDQADDRDRLVTVIDRLADRVTELEGRLNRWEA